MNRKIKFRVWDVVNKRMFPFEQAVWTVVNISTPDGRNYDVPLFCVAFLDGTQTKLIPQQFTGATDKNGKEIYEGDIMRYRGRIGRVEFFAAMYICSWDGQTDDELSHMMIGDMEVVGNICETPDISNIEIPIDEEVEEEENEDLSNCEQCGERAWDGRICHVCGMKEI